jgi:prophage regulatory protein
MMANVLRISSVRERTGLGRSTVYLLISEGTFPPPLKLTLRSSGWLSSWVDLWLEILMAKRDGTIDSWVTDNKLELEPWALNLINRKGDGE